MGRRRQGRAGGHLRQGAELLLEVGAPALAAYVRLQAAKELVADGRRAEADQELRAALGFYHGVGATRYVREGEALLAASA